MNPVRRPGRPWLFAAWMGLAGAIAVGGGLLLGVLAALQWDIGEDRWTQVVQAHGRLQLWAFVAVIVTALSYEFVARMNGRPAFSARLRVAVPGGLAVGALLQAAAQVEYESLERLGPIGGAVMLAAAVLYCVSIARVRPPQPLRLDPQPCFFWLAAVWLVLVSALSLVASTQWELGMALPGDSHAISEIFMRGFVLQAILAIAPRAFRGHLGAPALTAGRQIALLVLVNLGLVAWVGGQEAWVLPGFEPMVQLANVAFAAAIVLTTVWLRVFSAFGKRFRAEERYEWAIPLAWVGIVAYAAGLVWLSALPDAGLFREGAIRHVFLLGFVVPLILAMVHIVLSRFGTGTIPWPNLLTAGFVLSLAAWPLRVLPALGSESPGDFGQGLMGLAGLLTMASLGLTMLVCFRTAAVVRKPVQRFLQSIPG